MPISRGTEPSFTTNRRLLRRPLNLFALSFMILRIAHINAMMKIMPMHPKARRALVKNRDSFMMDCRRDATASFISPLGWEVASYLMKEDDFDDDENVVLALKLVLLTWSHVVASCS